jgi:membrane protein involved in colicin uptake
MARVRISSPAAFGVLLSHHNRVEVTKGISVVDRVVAEHKYAKAHGVEILAEVPDEELVEEQTEDLGGGTDADAEAEAKEKAEAEAKVKAEAEAKVKAEAEAKAGNTKRGK